MFKLPLTRPDFVTACREPPHTRICFAGRKKSALFQQKNRLTNKKSLKQNLDRNNQEKDKIPKRYGQNKNESNDDQMLYTVTKSTKTKISLTASESSLAQEYLSVSTRSDSSRATSNSYLFSMAYDSCITSEQTHKYR